MRAPLVPALLSSILLLSACGGGGGEPEATDPGPVPTPKARLQPKSFAADCGDFLSYAAESLSNQYLQVYRCFADQACPQPAVGLSPTAPAAPTDSEAGAGSSSSSGGSGGGSGAAPTRVSQTNTQEAGVDEADIVKVDPEDGRLYILSGRRLTVVEAFPPAGLASRPLTELVLAEESENFYAQGLYLDAGHDRLVVLGDRYDGGFQSVAVALLIDIQDPAEPVLVERLELAGYSIDSRRIGSRVHRVVGYQPPLPAWFHDGGDPLDSLRQRYLDAEAAGRRSEASALRAEIGAEIARRTRGAGAASLLPRLRRQLGDGTVEERQMTCAEIAHAEVSTGLGFALIDSFSSDGSAPRASAGLVNNGHLVYGSARNLYLLQGSSGWFFAPTQLEETAIYRLALSATGAASFQGVGKVAGQVLNAYSLSEHEGHLRVASTQSRFGPDQTQTSSLVTVLKADVADDLPEVGRLSGLAPGERIQGARMIGDRGYLVTFRQVDPLFGIDLADPARPRVVSELKIPGFSSYLMPLGDQHLLTIGRAGSDEGLNGQVGIQLFAVGDLAAIRQLAGISPPAGSNSYSYSIAEYDPHAFSYFPDTDGAATPGTLAVPLQTWGESSAEQFTGFLVVRVDPAAAQPLRELARISHAEFPARREHCGFAPCADYYLNVAEPRRAVFQEDDAGAVLYSISSVGIIASEAADPDQEIARKALPYDEPCCFFPAAAD